MKNQVRTLLICALAIAFTFAAAVQHDAVLADDDDAPDASQIEKFSTEELHTLVAPIALYPDPLLAQILPASAFPIQIVEAYKFTQDNPGVSTPPNDTTWDPSVIALINYPTVLKVLNDDPKWTDQLGYAASYQMNDVMAAIQQVRAEAQAVGNLQSNDKQLVSSDQGNIEIQPADPQYIYVPQYDPIYICTERLDNPYNWGPRYGFGLWLGNRWDWRNRRLWYGNSWRNGNWYHGNPVYWRPPVRPIPPWYLRNGNRRPGPALPGRPGYTGGRYDRVKPIISRPRPGINRPERPTTLPNRPEVRPGIPGTTRPAINSGNRLLAGEDAANRRNQTQIEANRGRISRERPVVKEPVVREPIRPAVREPVRPVVREPVRPAIREPVRPAVTQRPSMHEEMGRTSDRNTATRESSRGSSSRGSSGNGGGRKR